MELPKSLFRFRDFTNNYEFEALEQSYIWAAKFESLNDPMEAFLRFDQISDRQFEFELCAAGKNIGVPRKIVKNALEGATLACFSTSQYAILMWGYYANSFKGACLEYDTAELMSISEFTRDTFVPVTYMKLAPPHFAFNNFGDKAPMWDDIVSRLRSKPLDWVHENEWRTICHQEGKHHISDLALKNVFCGPRMPQENKNKICEIFKNRMTSIFEMKIDGYDLKPVLLQKGREKCDAERIAPKPTWNLNNFGSEEEIKKLLDRNFSDFVKLVDNIVAHPNCNAVNCIQIAPGNNAAISCCFNFVFRAGGYRDRKYYFNSQLQQIGQ